MPAESPRPRRLPRRYVLAVLWCALIGVGFAFALSRRAAIQTELQIAVSLSLVVASAFYLLLWGARPFTLVPSTYLVLVALPFFPPGLLFGLTLLGVLASSSIIYAFARALRFTEAFEQGRHQARIARLKAGLERHQLPIIIGWSFFPLTPTDLICYVAGLMEIRYAKFLAGVLVGKGAICAIYIFGGDSALRLLQVKP